VIDDVVVAGEDPIGEPAVAHELPDVFLRVQLGTFGRQGNDGDVVGHDQPRRQVPSGLIDQQRRMAAGCDLGGDRGEVKVPRLGVAPGQDEAGRFALCRADGAEDVGRGSALVMRRRGPGAAPGPAPGDLVLLAEAGLVAEPDLYVACIDALGPRDLVQSGGEAFY